MYRASPEIEASWARGLQYFKSRKAVLFLSYCRFWERHGFVQQSIAQLLARSGVEVVWLDGAGWRQYEPVVMEPHPNLTVLQLPQLPFQRLSLLNQWDCARKTTLLKRWTKKLGGNPVIWVEGGIDDRIAAELPYIDVFSVFDDPYRHPPTSALCERAKTLVCQNRTAQEVLLPLWKEKCHVLLPPVDVSDASMLGTAEVFLPAGFPQKVMGYVGSFFDDGFDLDLFESFIKQYPDWGFVLMGRTDPAGARRLAQWKPYKNFHYFPWVPRNQVASVWKQIQLTLLFYKENPTQDGAFPVKIVEALRFGVPCIATKVPKTADLEGVFPRGSSLEELKGCVERALATPTSEIEKKYYSFASQMDPRNHLGQVAHWLSQRG